jgi:hypothetical protein
MDKITAMSNQRKSEVLFNIFTPSLPRWPERAPKALPCGRELHWFTGEKCLFEHYRNKWVYYIAGHAPARIGCLEVIQNLGIRILNAMSSAILRQTHQMRC